MADIRIPLEFQTFLKDLGLNGTPHTLKGVPLSGGVSSDIWRIDLPSGPICIKKALSKLKVQADWTAPIERNANEVKWMKVAAQIISDHVPPILADDPEIGMFAMPFLHPDKFKLWKTDLLLGYVDQEFASSVGSALAKVHAATIGDENTAKAFATDAIFHSIRLEPYLETTAQVHADVAEALHKLVTQTSTTRQALVHGDISPKNILIGPKGPIFLDAECAWYGDPAFDLAFCLNHFLLKCLHLPKAKELYLASFKRLAASYLQTLCSSHAGEIEKRAAQLIPGLLLARIDGKSPVEYITQEKEKNLARRTAKALLKNPVSRLSDLNDRWQGELKGE